MSFTREQSDLVAEVTFSGQLLDELEERRVIYRASAPSDAIDEPK
jgi:hypothetical protein